MDHIDIKDFDDELQIMNELMDEEHISLKDDSFKMAVATLKLKKAVVVNAGATIRHCVEKLLARHIGCLIVVENKKVCGILTERDVLMRIAGTKHDLDEIIIDDFMTRNPQKVKIDDTLESVMRLMHKGNYRHVIVADKDDIPISVVSIKDIVACIIDFFPQDVLNLPPHPIRVGTKNREGG